MTAKERLHQLVEDLPEEDAEKAYRWFEYAEARKSPLHKTATPDELRIALRRISRGVDPRIPPLPDEAISRESIYE